MKIYRGDSDTCTDRLPPSSYIDDWKDGARIHLSGTKGGKWVSRQTHLKLEIDIDDVLALSGAAIERYRMSEKRLSELEAMVRRIWVLADLDTRTPEKRLREIAKMVEI